MMLKNLASGIRHTWALLPALPCTGGVTSEGYFTSLGLSLPGYQVRQPAASTAWVAGRMKRSNHEERLVQRLAHSKNSRADSDPDC